MECTTSQLATWVQSNFAACFLSAIANSYVLKGQPKELDPILRLSVLVCLKLGAESAALYVTTTVSMRNVYFLTNTCGAQTSF